MTTEKKKKICITDRKPIFRRLGVVTVPDDQPKTSRRQHKKPRDFKTYDRPFDEVIEPITDEQRSLMEEINNSQFFVTIQDVASKQ